MRKGTLILGMTLAVLLAVWGEGKAQGLQLATALQFRLDGKEAHSLKFLCGNIPPPGDDLSFLPELASGTYLTVINVHNLGPTTTTVMFYKDGSLIRVVSVLAGQSTSIKCSAIIEPTDPFSEGFVTVRVHSGKGPLNVVGVYTLSP